MSNPLVKAVGFEWRDGVQMPKISLSGEKVREAGFDVGGCMAVDLEKGRITIRTCGKDVTTNIKRKQIIDQIQSLKRELN